MCGSRARAGALLRVGLPSSNGSGARIVSRVIRDGHGRAVRHHEDACRAGALRPPARVLHQQRDGFVTARELCPWVRTYVSAEAQSVLGTSVTPLFKDLDRVVSKGEFVFTRAK